MDATRLALTDVSSVISQVHDGICRVKVNKVKVGFLRSKAKSIEKSVKGSIEKISENEWLLDQEDVLTVENKSKYIEEVLNDLNDRIIRKTRPRRFRWFRGRSHKALLDLSEGVLKEVDAKSDEIKKELEERLQSARICVRPRRYSICRRGITRPHPIDSLQVSPSGVYMDIKWKDSSNAPRSLTGYSVLVNNLEVDFVPPNKSTDNNESTDNKESTDKNECTDDKESTDNKECTDSNDSDEYSMSLQLKPWHTYRIEVFAENSRGQSDPVSQVVRMNQHSPTVKPTINIRNINALSKSSVRVTIPLPRGSAQETIISDCKVLMFENNNDNPLGLKKDNLFRRGEMCVEIDGLDSAAQYTLHAMFCNDHGDGPMSDPVEFKIDSLEPSEPLLGIESFTDRSIKLRWRVKTNAGSVKRYLLFQGAERKCLCSTNELYYEVKGLKPNTKYFFSVTAEFQKAGENCTSKESILMPCLTYLL